MNEALQPSERDSRSVRIDLLAHRQDGQKTGLYAGLPLAPRWACLYSLTLYIYLWGCGAVRLWQVAFSEVKAMHVRADITLLILLYLAETLGAFATKRSTMKNWRQIDFLLHHVPFVAVVGTAVLFTDVVPLYPFTLPLDLLTCANEAVAAARALGIPRWIDIPNRFYLIVLVATLILAELYESIAVLRTSGLAPLTYVLALLTLPAPVYHGWMVLPYCWKIVTGWTRAKMNGEEYPARKKPAARVQ